MALLTIDSSLPDEDEQDYDKPSGSVWIVSVDIGGLVSVLETPNIHYSFFDHGATAEELGLPPDMNDTEAGVYKWTCSFTTSVDWESGHVDDYFFEPTKIEQLWPSS